MTPSGTILGYHGCSAEVARRVVLRELSLRPSANQHDWLGKGVYFWAHDPIRAGEWALAQGSLHGATTQVLGAIIELGSCLNLAERTSVEHVAEAYSSLRLMLEAEGRLDELPRNKGGRRSLDYCVMEALHALRADRGLDPYDTVIGYFGEGAPIYEGAELRHQNHLQLCVRRPGAVIGFFLPPDP